MSIPTGRDPIYQFAFAGGISLQTIAVVFRRYCELFAYSSFNQWLYHRADMRKQNTQNSAVQHEQLYPFAAGGQHKHKV